MLFIDPGDTHRHGVGPLQRSCRIRHEKSFLSGGTGFRATLPARPEDVSSRNEAALPENRLHKHSRNGTIGKLLSPERLPLRALGNCAPVNSFTILQHRIGTCRCGRGGKPCFLSHISLSRTAGFLLVEFRWALSVVAAGGTLCTHTSVPGSTVVPPCSQVPSLRFLSIGLQLRSTHPPHGWSPFRSCASLRSP